MCCHRLHLHVHLLNLFHLSDYLLHARAPHTTAASRPATRERFPPSFCNRWDTNSVAAWAYRRGFQPQATRRSRSSASGSVTRAADRLDRCRRSARRRQEHHRNSCSSTAISEQARARASLGEATWPDHEAQEGTRDAELRTELDPRPRQQHIRWESRRQSRLLRVRHSTLNFPFPQTERPLSSAWLQNRPEYQVSEKKMTTMMMNWSCCCYC